jgi:hypothetical protein
MFERQSLKLYFCIGADIFILHNLFRVGTLVTKFPLVQMYPVAKNYFGGLLQAHSFSCYVRTFACSDIVEIKGRSKASNSSGMPQHQKQAAARGSSEAEPQGSQILFLSRHSRWRYRPTLSCHWYWRDQSDMPCHQVKNAVFIGLGHTLARQHRFVAPVVLARQIPSVAPMCGQAQ